MRIAENENYKKIDQLVSKYFSLTETSIQKFRNALYNREIDTTFYEIIKGNSDLRIAFDIPYQMQKNFDQGWDIFRRNFYDFISEYDITYHDFYKGYVMISKNKVKIAKAVKEFYKNKNKKYAVEIEENINEIFIAIGQRRLPKKGSLKLIISLNFADWFLAATAENWSSCINLESEFHGSYWLGLPSTILDKNRALLYITDGEKKNYHGITAEKILSRSWLLLSEKDCLTIVRWFPQRFLNLNNIKKITGIENINHFEGEVFISKYPVELLEHTNGIRSFIYLDNIGLDSAKKFNSSSSCDHIEYFYKNKEINNPIFYFKGGLSYLIEHDIDFLSSTNNKLICSCCGEMFNENFFVENGELLCESCYFEKHDDEEEEEEEEAPTSIDQYFNVNVVPHLRLHVDQAQA